MFHGCLFLMGRGCYGEGPLSPSLGNCPSADGEAPRLGHVPRPRSSSPSESPSLLLTPELGLCFPRITENGKAKALGGKVSLAVMPLLFISKLPSIWLGAGFSDTGEVKIQFGT